MTDRDPLALQEPGQTRNARTGAGEDGDVVQRHLAVVMDLEHALQDELVLVCEGGQHVG